MNVYVYYDVPLAVASALEHDVGAMQRRLADATGIDGRLMRRPLRVDGHETWMEVYEGGDERFVESLRVAAADVDWRGAGVRHVERFVEIAARRPPCA